MVDRVIQKDFAKAVMVASGGLTGGNFWKGFLQGGVVAGLNHGLHRITNEMNNTDVSTTNNNDDTKRKIEVSKELQKRIESSSKTVSAMEVLNEMVKEGLVTAREAMSLSEKIGTFKQFSQQFKFVKNVGKGLGWFSKIGSGAFVLMDMKDYVNGDISGAVLAYKTTGNIASVAAGTVTASPIVGVGVSQVFHWGEKLLNRISSEMTRINNSNGYFLNNFHP
jgi:hypothetical protein